MLAAIAICILLFIAWLCLTEFSYVPLSANKWVYQVFAKEYEAKWNSTAYSDMDFQQPIIDALRPALEGNNERILVDLACGTGRMSRLVLAQEWFSGQVIAIDQSREMLHVLERETQNWPVELRSRLKVLCSNLDGRFTMPSCDAIAFMEAGELIPNFPFVLTQIARSLTSGGILVLRKGSNTQCILEVALFAGLCPSS